MVQDFYDSLLAKVSYIAVVMKPEPERELQREAPPLSFGFYVLTYFAMAIEILFQD